jgi:Na+/H+ antiporter NhaD/arsenite permease-like protein
MKTLFQKAQHFMKSETVLFISGIAAILTMFFVPPSEVYIEYLDLRVLVLLFCLMAVVAGLNETGVFLLASNKLLNKTANTRTLSFALIMLCFFSSMLITNDVALITFVPFTIMILSLTGQMKILIRVIVLETIAANLGSMLTPVGNPQNLYLYSNYDIPIKEFLQITFPYTVASFIGLCIIVFTIKREHLSFKLSVQSKNDTKKSRNIIIYGILFLVSLACVLRLMDYRITLLIVLITILLFDRHVLKKVDYSLLMTFVCFFIFVGNIGNIPMINEFLANLFVGRELPVSIAASQIISNVPAAVLLSAFTEDYKDLILGTDLGGLGTLVASLASLISYKFYCKTEGARPGKFLGVFTLYNIMFLALLCIYYITTNYII